MFSVNVSCAVCKASFTNLDTIYSSVCGHIYHYSCWQKWHFQSTSCPTCRSQNPQVHPIYLNFENGVEFESILNGFKSKLESTEEKYKQIQEEMRKKMIKIDSLKRLYNVSEQWRAELQYKIQTDQQQAKQQLANNSEDLTRRFAEIEMNQNHNKILDKIDENSKRNSEKLVEENLKLKKSLSESETLRIILNQKIEIQEQRLKYMMQELQNNFIESLKKENKRETFDSNFALRKSNGTRNRKKLTPAHEKAENVSIEKLDGCNINQVELKNPDSFKLTQPNVGKIVIMDFPRANLVYPLQDTVILLASKMGLNITSEYISKAYIINPRNKSCNLEKVFILVEFNNIETKSQFLKHSNRLKFYSSTKNIKLKEYVEEHTHAIFKYANRNLRAKGIFEYIACKDNKVIAKKKLNNSEEIVIRSQRHVDEILQKENEVPASLDNLNYSVNEHEVSSLEDLLHCFL